MRAAAIFLLALGGALHPALADGVFFDTRLSAGGDGARGGMRFGGEAEFSRFRLALFADAEFASLPLGSRVRILDDREHVLGERGVATGPGFAVAVPAGEAFALVAGAGASWAEGFKGDTGGGNGWSGWTEAGLRYRLGELCHVEACWQYRPLPDAAPNRLALQFRFRPA